MFAVIKIHLASGEVNAYGPFSDKRNARKAEDWHRNPLWHTMTVPLARPLAELCQDTRGQENAP